MSEYGDKGRDRSNHRGNRRFNDRDGSRPHQNRGGDRRGGDGERRGSWDKDRRREDRREGGFRGGEGRGGFRKDDRRGGDRRDDRRGADHRGGNDRRNGERRDEHRGGNFRGGEGRGGFRDDRRGGRRFDRDSEPRGPHTRRSKEDRPRKRPAPELPEGISHRDVSSTVRQELKPLSREHAETVLNHIAAAGALLDIDPEAAYDHAHYAVESAGRIPATREALGLVAYQIGKYEEAIRELRTHRRITGVNDNLAIIADSERGRGRPAKAVEIFEETNRKDLSNEVWIELVIVAAGAHSDLGDNETAKKLLEAQGFTGHKPGAAVRLLSSYADLLRHMGDAETGEKYEELARLTAKNAGVIFGEEDIDPNEGIEIFTIEEEPEDAPEPESTSAEDPAEPAAQTAGDNSTSAESAAADTASATPVESAEPDASSAADAPSDEQAESAESAVNAETAAVQDTAPAQPKTRTLQQEIEDETDEILREAGIDPKDLAP